jgi:hypothetical protein
MNPDPSRLNPSLSSPIFEDYYNCGIFTLRTPTVRGNVLVVNNVFDFRAIEGEVKEGCSDWLTPRVERIAALIREDRELTPNVKFAALKLLPLYQKRVDCVSICLGVVTVIFFLAAVGLIVPGVLSMNAIFWSGIGVLFISVFCAIGLGLHRWFLWRKTRPLEEELRAQPSAGVGRQLFRDEK